MSDLRKKIKEAIKFTGVNSRLSGGWIDAILDPIVDKLVDIFNEEGGEIMTDTFRKEYTPLNDGQKELMSKIKAQAEELEKLFDVANTPSVGRMISLAKTNLEQSVMWAVKAVTSPREQL